MKEQRKFYDYLLRKVALWIGSFTDFYRKERLRIFYSALALFVFVNTFGCNVIHLNCFWWIRGHFFSDGLYFTMLFISTISDSSFFFCYVTDNLLFSKGQFELTSYVCVGHSVFCGFYLTARSHRRTLSITMFCCVASSWCCWSSELNIVCICKNLRFIVSFSSLLFSVVGFSEIVWELIFSVVLSNKMLSIPFLDGLVYKFITRTVKPDSCRRLAPFGCHDAGKSDTNEIWSLGDNLVDPPSCPTGIQDAK